VIAVIDHNYSNLKSICNALGYLNISYEVIKPETLSEKYSKAIIPGVGNFSKTMTNLIKDGGKEKIFEFSRSKKKIMGICLGMQILASTGEESGPTEGLNLIPGNVKKIQNNSKDSLPHIGWNTVKICQDHPVLNGIKDNMDFYFVHSYRFCPIIESYTIGQSFYSEKFSSIIAKENVIGFQFHPEKSQKYGLKIINNFCNW
jgi:imidazole glycerol-phosphate synthase subunit HisH